MRMPHFGESRRDDLFVRHLLGELSEDETQQVEEDCVIDDAAAARLARVENDLVDAYVRGTMTGQRRRRFDAVYLVTPLRREKVAFAKRFLASVDAEAAGHRGDGVGVDAPRAAMPAAQWFSWSIAAAAALFLATGALLVRDVRLRRDMNDTRARLTSAEQRADSVSAQLSEQQRATAAARQALAEARGTPPSLSPPAIALVLAPQTRGLERMPVVTVPVTAKDLPLDLTVVIGSASRYSVSLKDPATSAIVWRSRPLALDRRRQPAVVRVYVPAALLKTQHYALDLFSVDDGAEAFVGTYAFEIVRP